MKNCYLILMMTLLCQGCLCSDFLYEEPEQPKGEFITLHSVPDRPMPPDVKSYQVIRHNLQQQHYQEKQAPFQEK